MATATRPKPLPTGVIDDDDVAETLAGLTSGAVYLFTDIQTAYEKVARRNRHTPGHPLMLGKALVAAGCVPRRHKRSKRTYLIP